MKSELSRIRLETGRPLLRRQLVLWKNNVDLT